MPRNQVAWRRLVFVALIIASLALLTVTFREADTGPVHSVQQFAAGLLSPLQSWGARVAKPFQDGYTWFRTIWSAHKRADELEAQVQTLQGEVIQLEEAAEENTRLKGLLDLADPQKVSYPDNTKFMVAQVIAKSPSRWQNWVLIDKGTNDGLRLDLPVVGATPIAGETLAGKGLVGKITSINAHTAVVTLLTDSTLKVAAKIQGQRAEGVVEGSVSGRLTMDYVDRDIDVQPKLVIVTSGFGGVYPADIPIGIVASVSENNVNIYRDIEVQSFVDFRVLEEVMVIIVPEEAGPGS
jgi:rod shape-determining protein MreC